MSTIIIYFTTHYIETCFGYLKKQISGIVNTQRKIIILMGIRPLYFRNLKSHLCYVLCFFFLWRCGPTRAMAYLLTRFLDHTQRRTTVGRTSLDEWSVRRRDLYLTTHNTHDRETSMTLAGFEPTISAGELPQTYALDRAATGTVVLRFKHRKIWNKKRENVLKYDKIIIQYCE